MSYVYLLLSDKDNRWYIGCSDQAPADRLHEHNAGRVRSTRSRRPFRLAYFEKYRTHAEAAKREWDLKHPIGFLEKKRITAQLLSCKETWPIYISM